MVYSVHKGKGDQILSAELRKQTGFTKNEFTDEFSQHLVKLLLSTKMIMAAQKPDGSYDYDLDPLNNAIQSNETMSQI